jgi:hypothetical protein
VAVPARAAPVPECTIHSATEKRKGLLAPFTADRSAPRGSLGSVADDPQLPGGTRLTLAPRPPGLPPPPVRPTHGGWPVAQLQAARCAPRASAGAASRSSSGPFEVVARTQGIPRGVPPRVSLTERSIFEGRNDYLRTTRMPLANSEAFNTVCDRRARRPLIELIPVPRWRRATSLCCTRLHQPPRYARRASVGLQLRPAPEGMLTGDLERRGPCVVVGPRRPRRRGDVLRAPSDARQGSKRTDGDRSVPPGAGSTSAGPGEHRQLIAGRPEPAIKTSFGSGPLSDRVPLTVPVRR